MRDKQMYTHKCVDGVGRSLVPLNFSCVEFSVCMIMYTCVRVWEDVRKSLFSGVQWGIRGVYIHRLIYDPATGRPRGFGFCEYEDGETAMSAVRNLAGREVGGRPLRIDSATNAPGGEFRGPGNKCYGAPLCLLCKLIFVSSFFSEYSSQCCQRTD